MIPKPPALKTPPGIFITGTDTSVGKTLFTAALLHVCSALGIRSIGMKPVAAGAEQVGGTWINDDVMALTHASAVQAAPGLINPYLFREAIAPHIAADHKGVRIEIPHIVDCYRALTRQAELVLVEGVGGFRVPLSPLTDTADLAVALDLPVVLVVGMRLGCINHALLTAEAIAARGLKLAGWVANRIDPEMVAYAENLKTLESLLEAPLLAELPFQRAIQAHGDAELTAELNTELNTESEVASNTPMATHPVSQSAARWIPPSGIARWLQNLAESEHVYPTD